MPYDPNVPFLHFFIQLIYFKSCSPAQEQLSPLRTCYQHLLLANTLKVGPLVTADHKFSAEFMAITAPCTEIRGRLWNPWNHKTYTHAIWCDPVKFTMENVSNHSFYVLVFWVLCKWNLTAQHKLFFPNHISCSAQLLTFPGCLKETQKSCFSMVLFRKYHNLRWK